ncbi:MAG: hypothetical protein RTU30_09400, partial [Candidatus Thorarchaeota archaeon]
MSYLTWRSYVKSGWICLGAILLIAGAVLALLDPEQLASYGGGVLIGGIVAVVGLLLIIAG